MARIESKERTARLLEMRRLRGLRLRHKQFLLLAKFAHSDFFGHKGARTPRKRLIKNCIICWNYLYLSQKLAEIDDPAKREELLQAMAHGSAAAWGHLNLLGEYDFSEDKLQDSVGIKPPKLTD